MGYYAAIKILFAKNKSCMGIPWQSSSEDCALSLPSSQVWFLVRELRSHKLHSIAKKKKKKLNGAKMLTKYKLKKEDIKYFVHYGPNI